MPERSYHHGNLRSALLERAWDVVDSGGVEGLSLRSIARDLEVSHGASARHFRDRQALLDALAVEGFARLNAALEESADAEETFAGRLEAAGQAYISFAVAHPGILGVMYTAKHHPEASAELAEASHAGMSGLIALVEAGQAAGEAREGDAAQLALIAFAAVHGVAMLSTDDLLDGVGPEDAARAVLGFLTEGLRTSSTTPITG
ncbi:TetR/AcrR family transcriptional regulator [Microbacterium sp. BK668]|uniref:TetR/AcrR family transcriptional regulator n=1 Tax=Microbacterium sp. BK668 TaxID=2512118 RepID=UPI00105DBB46|nr:TetR/AcrR family transcriptional regulator [Microbacterium sp. BK668]TDN93138.1 TetR family transcriptional regulator [Microbacterium sp. BK668]